MRYRRRHIEEQPPESSPTTMINLSLFLMLLAFFIVLNGVSTFEEHKYYPLLRNIRDTFSISSLRQDEFPSERAAEAASIREGQVIDRIDALFNAQITGFQATRSAASGVMQVDLPLAEFERAVTMVGQVDLTKQEAATGLQTYFLPTLVSLLHEHGEGHPYRMEMIFHTRDNPPLLLNSDPLALQDAMRRAAAYPAIFEKAGLPRPLMDVGIRQGDPAQVTLTFRPVVPYSPVSAAPREGGRP